MVAVLGPPDVVASVIAFLRDRGFDARSRVPIKREPGMVRVQRVGGVPEGAYQDQPRVLIECWHSTQGDAFDLARSIWGLFAAADRTVDLPGLIVHKIGPSTMPVQYPDDYAPDLDRHQFEIEAHVRMEKMEVPL